MSSPFVSALSPGAVFHDRYTIVRLINAGGMGAVYEVTDARTNTPRALKVMLPGVIDDADLRERFEREAKVTGCIQSDHIVRVSDAGFDEPTKTPFFVMDLLRGEELGRIVKRSGALPPEEVIVYLNQVALALDKTHAAGIIHRDLKPLNLFLTHRDDGSPCVKIFDFGIAKVVSKSKAAQEQSTRQVGTPLYMAPEQVRGDKELGPAVDIHALGHIAYTLLVGEAYWAADMEGQEIVYPLFVKIIAEDREPASVRAVRKSHSLPEGFDAWFAKATAFRPDDRFDRATTAIAALADVLGVELAVSSLRAASLEGVVPSSVPSSPRSAAAPPTPKTLPAPRAALAEPTHASTAARAAPLLPPEPAPSVTPATARALDCEVTRPSNAPSALKPAVDCDVTRPSNVGFAPRIIKAESAPASERAAPSTSPAPPPAPGERRVGLRLALAGFAAGILVAAGVFMLRAPAPSPAAGSLQGAPAQIAAPKDQAKTTPPVVAPAAQSPAPAPSVDTGAPPAAVNAVAAPNEALLATPAATVGSPPAPAVEKPAAQKPAPNNPAVHTKRKREGIL